MASEASWQTGNAGAGGDAFTADQPMDQGTVESLLRRLVERVEDSERRYGEALDELHARLDQLSQTTEAARDTGAPEDADTFDRLHSQVSKLARRLEQDPSNPLEDFERLGKALSGGLRDNVEKTAAEPFGYDPEPSPFAQATMAAKSEPAPASGYPDFGYTAPEPSYSAAPSDAEPFEAETFESKSFGSKPADADFADLDKRLVDMAQRLEQSIGAAMPTSAIEALNQRLDEIGSQLAQALEKVPTREALDHVERQISDMGQQLGRAEEQLGKVGGVEAHLLSLIERLDERASAPASIEPAQMEDIANKAANEAARLVAGETRQNAERLDAMHRDIKTMSDKSRESGDRLVSTLEAVHESLKQLVQQVERGAAFQTRPRAPFMERARQAEARPAAPQAPQFKMPMPQQRPPEPTMAQAATAAAKTGELSQNAAKERLRDRLGAAIPDFQEGEAPPPFGRAKRSAPGEKAVDLDAAPRGPEGLDAAPDDLVAAARRAAQAAAARAEERGGRRRSSSPLPGSAPGGEQQGRRKRSLLIISAAVLLALSAILLYGRLSSKPETDATPASTEQTAPAPSGDTEGTTAPQGGETAPADTPEKSGAWQPLPDTGASPSDSADDDSAPSTGVTDMAKSSAKSGPAPSSGNVPAMPASELSPEPQLASLHPTGQAALPPGVIFSVEEPGDAPDATAAAAQGAAPLAMPANLPLPPAALGPLALRKAAAKGDPKAQYEIGVRYADGVGTKADLKTAAEWFDRAASAGLAPAQYRLAAMYERGLGVGEDLGQARTWYAAAAEKGNIKAMHNLAVSVSGRDGSTPDYKLAAKWYAEAAAYGLPDSQFNLAILAEHGLGMKKDPAEAYKWFSLAAAHGDADAAKRREVIRVQLAPAALAQAEATVKAWKAKPAIAGANEVAENSAWAAKAPATEAVSLVSRAQTLLNKLGYDVGPPDGLVGPRTQTAIKIFQQRNGLSETGEVSIPLVTQLERLSS